MVVFRWFIGFHGGSMMSSSEISAFFNANTWSKDVKGLRVAFYSEAKIWR